MVTKLGTLLVLNYVMDSNHPVLSHQADVVDSLSKRFSNIIVLTGSRNSSTQVASNVETFDTHWVAGQNFRNVIRFYRELFSIFRKNLAIDYVFSHMTVVQSVLASPVLLLRGIPHILWYAHRSSNLPLRFAGLTVRRILTSTSGSCPLKSKKVRIIGQGIDTNIFRALNIGPRQFLHMVHIGRADKSKKLEKLIEEVQKIRKSKALNITLSLIGNPSNEHEETWFNGIKNAAKQSQLGDWLKIQPGVNRLEIPKILSTMDIFVHAFEGSLDKTTIEATLCRVPVLSLNPEYLKIFGSWKKTGATSIASEYEALISRPLPDIEKEISRRYKIAHDGHSFERWISLIIEEIEHCQK